MAQAFDLMHALVAAVVVVVGRGGGVFFFIRSFLHTSLGRLYQPNSKRMFMFLFASGIYDARYNLGFSAFYVVCVCMVRSMLVRGKKPRAQNPKCTCRRRSRRIYAETKRLRARGTMIIIEPKNNSRLFLPYN